MLDARLIVWCGVNDVFYCILTWPLVLLYQCWQLIICCFLKFFLLFLLLSVHRNKLGWLFVSFPTHSKHFISYRKTCASANFCVLTLSTGQNVRRS